MLMYEKVGTRQGKINSKFEESGSQTFVVTADSTEVAPADIIAFVGVNIGDSGGGNAVCVDIDAKQSSTEDGLDWEVVISYGPREPLPKDPTLEPAVITEGFEHREKPFEEETTGVPIKASNGLKYLDAIMGDESRPTIKIEKNAWSWNRAGAMKYRDVCNQNAWFGFQERQLKVQDIGSQRIWSEEFQAYYYKIHLELGYDPKKWVKRVLDTGLLELVAPDDKLYRRILDDYGEAVCDAVPLDGKGHKLATGAPYVWNEYVIYNSMDFSVFNWMIA